MTSQSTVLLNDGVAMPRFGLGVWQTPNDATSEAVRTALNCGYRLIDTAAIYANEQGVGRGLRGADVPREDVFVTTKLWNTDHGFEPTLRAFDASMEKLGLDTLGLYLIHWPDPSRGLYLDSWRAMIRLRDEGRVRSIGVSNFQAEHIEMLIRGTGIAPSVNQIELHPRFQQASLREFNQRHAIQTESWSPLGQGTLLQNPDIARVASKRAKNAAQTIIRWHLDQGLVVIPKSVHGSRIRENSEVFDFTLDEDDRAIFAALDTSEGRIGPDPTTVKF